MESPPAVLRFIAHSLLITSLMLSIGLHWALVQSAAWVGMVVSYSQTTTMAEAVRMTFDGQHPCNLCRLVEKSSSQDSKSPKPTSPTKKLEMCFEPLAGLVLPGPTKPDPSSLSLTAQPRRDMPPRPPPRLAA